MLVNDGYIEVARFGQDHWSTMGYIASVMEDCSGFQVGFDARMRQGRRHFRVMREECPRPSRPGASGMGVVMEKRYSSRLKSGEQVDGHDDWHCVQDMVAAGLLGVIDPSAPGGVNADVGQMEPGVTLTFTRRGWEIAHQLREHKASGGRWANFEAAEVQAEAVE